MIVEYQDLIGKPFKDLGRGPDEYDCLGVVIEVARRFGNKVPDYGVSHTDPALVVETYKAVCGDYLLIARNELVLPSDILIYKRLDVGIHLGIMVDYYHFLHASEDVGVHRDRIDHPIIRHLIEGIYRCKTHMQ